MRETFMVLVKNIKNRLLLKRGLFLNKEKIIIKSAYNQEVDRHITVFSLKQRPSLK